MKPIQTQFQVQAQGRGQAGARGCCVTYRFLVAATTLGHLGVFLFVLIRSYVADRDLVFHTQRGVGRWQTTPCPTSQPTVAELGSMWVCLTNERVASLSFRWMVLSFSLLSALFQAVALWRGESYLGFVRHEGVNVLTMMEYSLSASLMVVDISLVLGVSNAMLLVASFLCTWAGCMCGLFAEVAMFQFRSGVWTVDDRPDVPKDVRWFSNYTPLVTHVVGWVLIGFPWVVILTTFQASSDVTPPPDFVFGIVASLAITFLGFGLVQFAQVVEFSLAMARRRLDPSHIPAAFIYVALSLGAKTLLALQVGAQLLY